MKVQPKYKKGQKVTMQFHMIGLTSEEVGACDTGQIQTSVHWNDARRR